MGRKWGAAQAPEDLPALSPTFARAVFSQPDAVSAEAPHNDGKRRAKTSLALT